MFDLNYAALVFHCRTDGSSEMPKAMIQKNECKTVLDLKCGFLFVASRLICFDNFCVLVCFLYIIEHKSPLPAVTFHSV